MHYSSYNNELLKIRQFRAAVVLDLQSAKLFILDVRFILVVLPDLFTHRVPLHSQVVKHLPIVFFHDRDIPKHSVFHSGFHFLSHKNSPSAELTLSFHAFPLFFLVFLLVSKHTTVLNIFHPQIL